MARDQFKGLDPIWKDAADQSSDEEVNNRIATAAKAKTEYEIARAADPILQQAKDTYNELDEPYKTDIKECNRRIRYGTFLLKQRGKV